MVPPITFELCKEFKILEPTLTQSKGKIVTFYCISTLNPQKYFNNLFLESHFPSLLCILCSFRSQVNYLSNLSRFFSSISEQFFY